MPNEIEIKPEAALDAAAHNAEVAAKLASQDIMGKTGAPSDDGNAGNALDALQKQAEEAAAKEKAAAEAPAKSPEELAKEKADVDAAAVRQKEADDEKTRAEALFKDSPTLPTGASPKASEAFTAVKIRAAQEIAKATAELEKLRKENAEYAEKVKNAPTPEALKELEDHRTWRAKLDVEADPKFKEYDKAISQTHEFIYAQLARSPVITPEVLAEIKKHGGPENVMMDKIYAAIKDPALQRTIESKIADIDQKKFEKAQAIEATKKNIGEYIAEKTKVATEAATRHNTDTEKHLTEMTKSEGFSWLNEKAADPKADEATRKATEEHNKFVTETKANLKAALQDDSPEMRAIMIAGLAQLLHKQRNDAARDAKFTAIEKELADVKVKYDKLRNASVSRLRESNAPTTGDMTKVKPKDSDQFTKSAGESLDDIRKQVTEERERALANK
jgi:hypothetical protein